MNHDNLLHLSSPAKPKNEARAFFDELGIVLSVAKLRLGNDKTLHLYYRGLRVVQYAIREGGLLLIEGIDSDGAHAAVLVHYSRVEFEARIVDKTEQTPLPAEMGFHTLFSESGHGADGSTTSHKPS